MNGMSPPDCPAIHQKKSAKTVTGNAGTSTAAQTASGINPVKYKPDAITQTAAPTQKIRATVVFFIPIYPSITTSTTRKKIRSEESEHMITYGAPGARNISAFAA